MLTADILRSFMLLPAPSGYEKEVAYQLRAEFDRCCDQVTIDPVGNVMACFTGKDPSVPVTMVYAHMDQLGFVVRFIEPAGYLRLERLGGIPEKVLPGLRIQIRTGDGAWVPGIIGSKSHHATPAEEKYKADPIDGLFVDIGARSAEEVHAMGILVGAPAVYEPSCRDLANGRICGTSIDNRGGLTALVLLAEQMKSDPPAGTVWLVGTVWEEFNLRGAMLAARTIKPAIAIALDVVLSGDTPDLQGRYATAVGQGPAMMLYNFHGRGTLNGTIPHPGLTVRAERAAGQEKINLQRFAGVGILTDSAYVQLEGSGIAALELGFPARYTHTPAEVCDPDDIRQLACLLGRLLRNLDSTFDSHRY
jgi:putative aminopeptidase FrvX